MSLKDFAEQIVVQSLLTPHQDILCMKYPQLYTIMIQLLHYVKSLVQVKGVNRIKSKQPEAIAVLWKYGQFSPQYNRNPIA